MTAETNSLSSKYKQKVEQYKMQQIQRTGKDYFELAISKGH